MNLKFRRQHPVGRFVLDFYCELLRVAIEVDGAIHLNPDQHAADVERQSILEEQGIRFIRVPGHLVARGSSAELMQYLTETLALQSGILLPSREKVVGAGVPSNKGAV